MSDRLSQMLAIQRQFQTRINGYDVDQQTEEDRVNNWRVSHMALIDELHEALHEIGWKPWATSRHFNHAAVKGELVDAFHFFMNLMLHADMTAEELYDGYLAKQAINNRRQDIGYDGVSTKCPICHRAYDDPAVGCRPADGEQPAYHATSYPYAYAPGTPTPLARPGSKPNRPIQIGPVES